MNDFQEKVIESLAKHAPVWIVGGAVRDGILGFEAKDMDLVTTIPSGEAQSILSREGLYPKKLGANFSALSLFEKDNRIDIVPIESLEQDAQRRDFTINAIYQDPVSKEIIDPLTGCKDLEERVLKTCGSARERFQDDPLRILRMVRFAVEYDLQIAGDTWEKAQELLPSLAEVSRERITAELSEILTLNKAEKAVIMLYDLGYWDIYVPELARLKGIVQNQYHEFDVWDHTLAVFRNTPADLFLRLAGLFHDIGKWETASRECYVRGRLKYSDKEYRIDDYKLLGTRSSKELDFKIKPFIDKELTILGARLDHYPDTVQFKKIITGEQVRQGLTYKEKGKRHFLNHERASSVLLKDILKRFTFSMFFEGAGQRREKDLLKLVENHMQATLTFMLELRNEGSRQSFRGRAAELTWFLCWDGRVYNLQNIHDFVLLWKADFEAKKAHNDEENAVFEKIMKELIAVGLWQNDNLDKIDWSEFYIYSRDKGLEAIQMGRYKDLVRNKAMTEMNVKLDKVFLDKAYREFK